ncbi:hypothetical protein J5Y04_30990 [Kitasatospora sp. RG8]|uniref:hypothetical protein n=1 Tax=Kitasatospora sp. RG8 TaxID=2820815 RepID=UPI001AE07AC7|nr:hypothetical protein [Kitasatospora sp. RG8]MBP0453935.1 hypothetical protein [Kitasatospora sp. RG8]
MLQDDQQAGPWGIVTPEFWAKPDAKPDPGPAEAAEWEDDLRYEEPAAVAAARTAASQRPPLPEAGHAARFAALAGKLSKPQTGLTLLLAAAEAVQLDQELSAARGPSDPNVIGVRELRALIAHLQGQRAEAARLYLHVTGLQATAAGLGHDLTKANAQRAFAEWRSIADPVERAAVGRDILPMLTAVAGPKAKPTREVQAALGK